MVSSRFFFNNFFTDVASQVSFASSATTNPFAAARVLGPQPIKSGFASMAVGGVYNSLVERTYRVECHSSTDGTFANSRIRWSDTGGAVWNQQNITPVNGSPIALSFNVTVTFTDTGVAPQFVVGDAWVFIVTLPYGPQKAMDGNRDTEWRSGTIPAGDFLAWQWDFGSAVTPQVIIADGLHTVPLRYSILGNLSGFVDPADFFLELNNVQTRLLQLISPSQPMRYWRLAITNTFGITLDYVRAAELYIGGQTVMGKNFRIGFRRRAEPVAQADAELILARGPGPVSYAPDRLDIEYRHVTDSGDLANLKALWAYTQDTINGVQRPFFFLPRDDNLTDWGLYHWVNGLERQHQFEEKYHVPMTLMEVVRTRPLI